MGKESGIDPAVLEYVAEGKEIVERIYRNLNSIENGDSSSETISSLYRDVHTLKGSSQLFSFKMTSRVSHAMEACLDPVRKNKMSPSKKLVAACTDCVSVLEKLILSIEKGGQEGYDEKEIIKKISRLIDTTLISNKFEYSVINDGPSLESKKTIVSDHSKNLESKILEVELIEKGGDSTVVVNSTITTDTSVRVPISLLDKILNIVGELVSVKNQFAQHQNFSQNSGFQQISKNLEHITTDLQTEVMKTRLQTIDSVVGIFHRVVKDLAKDFKKRIDLTIEGAETELDKSLLQAIKDPLNHLIRNCCDHGIETPENRIKKNKPETGHILIRSFHEGGQVVIEVSDDGAGIKKDLILAKAIEKGIITHEKAKTFSDREIYDLIFLPDFSTVSQVSDVSGRGVGMDVVKTNIERIGGSIDVVSFPNKGTTIQMRIPLTLAIVPALVVSSGKNKFAIPQVKLVELVRTQNDNDQGSKVEWLESKPMLRLRGKLLPLYDIRDVTKEPYDAKYTQQIYVAILNTGTGIFGVIIPNLLDTADIVIKPLNWLLNNLTIFSGATILGDGSVAMVLDVNALAQQSKILNKRDNKDEFELGSVKENKLVNQDTQEFLLFSLGTDVLHSVPLCLIQRLEEFEAKKIERCGPLNVIKYRGGVLPLIDLTFELGYTKASYLNDEKKILAVIVIKKNTQYYGLIVDEIVDIRLLKTTLDQSFNLDKGIIGNIIDENNNIIVMVDTYGVIDSFDNTKNGKIEEPQILKNRNILKEIKNIDNEMKYKSIRVLYADDVAFFRRHVSKVLTSAGIEVTTVEDGVRAIEALEKVEVGKYNFIISDIEMPNMNGLELAKEIKKREEFRHIPLVALTTRFQESDVRAGLDAGFDEYLEKLNPEKLLSVIQKLSKLNETQTAERALKL